MKNQRNLLFTIILVVALAGTACEGPEGPTGPQGPQGEQGPEGPQGPQGVEGTANATLYIFDGHSFNSSSSTERDIELRNESEMFQSVWQVYLVQTTEHAGNSTSVIGVYPLPGRGYFVTDLGDTEYRFRIRWMPDESIARFTVLRDVFSGGGEPYDNIHIIRIAPGEVMGKQVHAQSYIPDNLDLSDYHAVMEHYGLKQQATKHKVENTGYAEWSYQLEQLKKLREAGFTAMELRERGYTAKELKEAGYEAVEMKEAGFECGELKEAGFTAEELYEAGFTAEELKEVGFEISELREAGYK